MYADKIQRKKRPWSNNQASQARASLSFVDNRSEVQPQQKGQMSSHVGMQMQTMVEDQTGDRQKNVLQAIAYQSSSNQVQPAQRAASEVREVDITELSDGDARKHVFESFKKGQMVKPLVDESGKVVQRVPQKLSYGGGDLFIVLKSDLGKGTGTSKTTRAYVNNPGTPKPGAILFDYETANSTAKSQALVKGNKNAWEVENPEADRTYKSGSYWDAGHKLGRQNGGLGNDVNWVFPQNPAFNQGNSRNMDDVDETRPYWRQHEDDFNSGVRKDGAGAWWMRTN